MVISFFSNFFNHHQEEVSLTMSNKTDIVYYFVACEKIPQEKLDFGYLDMNKKYNFIVRPYEDEEQKKLAMELALTSDVVIFGSGDETYFDSRMKTGKLTFKYSERLFKKGLYRRYILTTFAKIYKGFIKHKKDLYVLCSSAYTSYDLSKYGFNDKRCFKWGYFTQKKEYDIDSLLAKKKNQILWVGRFLDWKHPEKAVLTADYLRQKQIDFKMIMVGEGEERKKIEKLVKKLKLAEYISLVGSVEYSKVRQYMEESKVFLFTSDFQEGWGAVLNEAMNSACAVVASHAIGAAPFMIENGVNGLIYKNDNNKSLFENTEALMLDDVKATEISRNAYRTITNTWNGKNAANNLIDLIHKIMDKDEENIPETGPCSRAYIYQNNWFKEV